MTDYLKSLPEIQVAGWYRRLADLIGREKIGGEEPMASRFLRYWLDNRDSNSVYTFTPPAHLQNSSYVVSTLQYHRKVFLTEEKARFTKSDPAWAGVVPRLQGRSPHPVWDMSQPIEMHYECLVEVGSGYMDIARIQMQGTPGERDLLTALRGFQLGSRVMVKGTPVSPAKVKIDFLSWAVWARDRYDWDYDEHFTVPNPDYGSKEKDAVRPMDQKLTVYHSNAKRLEDAKLAAPYNLMSKEWPGGESLKGPAFVDPKKALK